MDPKSFKEWLDQSGMSQREAALAAGMSYGKIRRFIEGKPTDKRDISALVAMKQRQEERAGRAAAPAPVGRSVEVLSEELKALDGAALEAFTALLSEDSSAGIKLGVLKLYCVYRYGRPLPLEKGKPVGAPAEDKRLLRVLEQLAAASSAAQEPAETKPAEPNAEGAPGGDPQPT